ncbi:hypothetical protein V9T40_006409 [Parthenolecanium corni]|uniref:Amino acid transporter transmembrane domain-containing protein n=1 Tax=Parthenolecanium corni TaxID=536013 RepID=A0AAN9Y5H9_9HEMI
MEKYVSDEEENLKSSQYEQHNYHSTIAAAFLVSSNVDDYKKMASKEDFEAAIATSALLQKEYDPHDFGNTDHPTSFWGTVFHLVIISFGPATLTLPKSFQAAGYIVGFAITLIIVYLYAYNMHMLVCSEYKLCKLKRVPHMTYSETLHVAISEGPEGIRWLASYCRFFIYVIFIVEWLGCCSLTVVLLSENLQTIYRFVYEHPVTSSSATEAELRTIMLCLMVPMMLLASIRKLNYLVPFSVAATTINAFCMLVIVYYIIVEPWPKELSRGFQSVTNVPHIAGAVLFNLSAAGIIMPLKNEMKNPRKFGNGFSVLVVSYIPVSISYAIFGLICSLKYGDTLKASVIQNLPGDQLLGQVAIALSTVTMAFIFPLPVYIVVDVLWNDILRDKHEKLNCLVLWEFALRGVIVVISFLAAYLVPNIPLFLSFSGTVCTSIDGIIVPAVIEMLVVWRLSPSKSKFFVPTVFKNISIIVLGFVLIVTGSMTCVKDIIDFYAKK